MSGVTRALPKSVTAGWIADQPLGRLDELCHNTEHPPGFARGDLLRPSRPASGACLFSSFGNESVSGTDPVKTLLLVDGSSYLYRAFHALPELRNTKGEPTGAIYGVLNMLRKLATDYKAGARAVRFRRQRQDVPRRHVRRVQGEPQAHARRLSAQVEPLHEAIARWAGRCW